MGKTQLNQWTINSSVVDDFLVTWFEAFLIDRKAAGMAAGTLYFYRAKLALFERFCSSQAITRIAQITPDTIRRFMLWLEEAGHNAGGQHGCFRALKTFLLWWERETEPEGWKNPVRKVKAPRLAVEPIDPVDLDTVQALVDTCERDTFHGLRDKAILLVLLDTGIRAAEFCALDLEDVSLITGELLVRQGKGRKPRMVHLSPKSRRAVRAYLKCRQVEHPALWITDEGERLTYWGLNEVIRRRANAAKVTKPELHDFRRAFALNMLRAGVDVFTLQKLMGHSDLQVLRRYLAQTGQDTQEAHRRGSPVELGLR